MYSLQSQHQLPAFSLFSHNVFKGLYFISDKSWDCAERVTEVENILEKMKKILVSCFQMASLGSLKVGIGLERVKHTLARQDGSYDSDFFYRLYQKKFLMKPVRGNNSV